MEVRSYSNYVIIMGDEFGKKKHLKIYCLSEGGQDYFSISIIKDGMDYGCMPSVFITKDNVVIQNNLEKGRQVLT